MNRFKNVLACALLILFMSAPRPACASEDWNSIMNSSRGTTVTFYGWGGDPRVNLWLDTFVAPRLKERYDISLERVGMDIGEILNKLLSEKTAGKSDGVIDVVWINGENFFAARQNGLLFGPFTGSLPNFRDFVDAEAGDVAFDFGFPTEGFEAPYGKAQLVFFRDAARLERLRAGHNLRYRRPGEDRLSACGQGNAPGGRGPGDAVSFGDQALPLDARRILSRLRFADKEHVRGRGDTPWNELHSLSRAGKGEDGGISGEHGVVRLRKRDAW